MSVVNIGTLYYLLLILLVSLNGLPTNFLSLSDTIKL